MNHNPPAAPTSDDDSTRAAEVWARVTGSTSATYIEERVAADGTVVETARATWVRS